MAGNITRDDVLNFLGSSGVAPLSDCPQNSDPAAWREWEVNRITHFVQQNPEAVLELVLDIAFNPPKKHFSEYYDDIKFGGCDLLAACSQLVPDLFLRKITVMLPLAKTELTRCVLIDGLSGGLLVGLGDSNLPQAFELLKSLMPDTKEYNNEELSSFVISVGHLGICCERIEETSEMLRQIQDATLPERKEVHEMLAVYFQKIEKAK